MIKFTAKQVEVLATIKAGNDGKPMTVYDIMEKLSYDVKRDALLHSLSRLVEAGYVERRGTVRIGSRSFQMFMCTSKVNEVI